VTRITGIKAITFDIDGTLWDFVGRMRDSLVSALQELEKHDPKAAALIDVDTMIETRDRVHVAMRDVTPDLVEIRKASFRQALVDAERPDDALAKRLADVYFEHRWAPSPPYDDVRPAMEALAPRFRLGAISNGNSYPERFGLGHLLSFCVYAQDHGGINKPDPRLYQIAIAEAGCQPHELLHVGDSLRSDVGGAKGVGAWAAWVNRDGASLDGEHQPDVEIQAFTELLEIL
jgi:putative hydrolase of the HAD superfamily